MPLYECVFIVRQDVQTPQVDALAASFADIVRQHGGQVPKIEPWGLRNLAYRINKNKKGHYVLMNIDAPAAAVLEMERNMKISEDVLRTLIVSVDKLDPNPSAILRRDDSGERSGTAGGGDRAPRSFDRSSRGGGNDRPTRAPRRDSASESSEGTAA